MELLELTNKTCDLLKCRKDEIISGIEKNLFSKDKQAFFKEWEHLIDGNFSPEMTQKIFQYYFSDRETKKQDFTPNSISRLVSSLASKISKDLNIIHDLCAGSGSLTFEIYKKNPRAKYICDEIDRNAITLLLFNLSFLNMRAFVRHANVLTGEVFKCWKLTPSDSGYSDIVEIDDEFKSSGISADIVVSNPPFNMKWEPPDDLFIDERFKGWTMPPASNANFAFVLTALNRINDTGNSIFILPHGILSNEGRDGEIRKELLKKGFIHQVITLPGKMFESTSIPTSILILNKNGNRHVRFVNARTLGEDQIREQKGQYGKTSQVKRTYRKQVRCLSEKDITNITNTDGDDKKNNVVYVPVSDILEKEDGILTPGRYLTVDDTNHKKHRDIGDIMDDINRISDMRNAVKITANECMLKKLGLSEEIQKDIISLQEKNEAIYDGNKKLFKHFGKELVREDYLTISKNKGIFKIEANQKDGDLILMQHFASIFMPTWVHHVRLMNSEENRLLKELRDRLLPDLMSGKIDVQDIS